MAIFVMVPAVGWSAVAPPGADGTGTMTVSRTSVPASATTALTFTYTASAVQALRDGTVTVTVPPGWTPPSPAPGAGFTSVSCAAAGCQLSVLGQQITVADVHLAPAQAFTISYGTATAPASGTVSVFEAAEESAPGSTPAALASSPTVTVACPDGAGTMTVSPAAMTASRTRTLIFRYLAGRCGVQPGGLVTLTVPAGWTSPTATPGLPGASTWSGGTPLSVSGTTVAVPVPGLAPGQGFSIRYQAATAPGSAASYVFQAAERSAAAGKLAPLAVSPTVSVRPASSSSARGRSAGTGRASPAASVTSADGARGSGPWLFILAGLGLLALLVLAGAAGVLAVRRLRQGRPAVAGQGVRVVAHPGPPMPVAVQDTESGPTLTVRIEPQAGATVTTIKDTWR
jgi:hypothetical protein